MVSIGVLLVLGLLTGGAIGLLAGSTRFGFGILTLVPIGAVTYVNWWQNQHPESIRSTSGLEFIFVPIPPSIAALIGYGMIWLIRDWLATKDLN
ncbi:hypothetical protein ASD76_16960 [Altererythrobacter sp. Root672]|nr:hypothetical protein ASD76_16960 [Altererythrobacter sp. Root672]